MLHLLDTDICSYAIRGTSASLDARLKDAAEGSLAISSVTRAELRFGLEKRGNPRALSRLVNAFLDQVQVVPWDGVAADRFARLRAQLERVGTPIGIFDTLRTQAQHFGFDSFLKLVALIGLNLVLVNLLPIPITDGGQLVFLAIETAIGKPLPPLVRTIAAYIGLALVVAMMLFVTTLDISRRI